jgi:Icc-related predicted phosphoesterase
VQVGALGDIHGDFETVRRIQHRHPEIRYWLCVGDVADDHGRYEPFDAPVIAIKGNNESFDAIADGTLPATLQFIPNGRFQQVGPFRVAALGGTLAPTWYETASADLPHPRKGTARATELADKRRHFVREEVAACQAMRDVDILLTHEAPRPYFVTAGPAGARGTDAGKTPINEVLATLQPSLHLFGHHHRFTEHVRQGVRSVGLDLVSRSYLLIASGDDNTPQYTHVTS